MSAHAHGFNGWDIVERRIGWVHRDKPDAVVEISAETVSLALLIEMERPPWYREIDDRKRREREEAT